MGNESMDKEEEAELYLGRSYCVRSTVYSSRTKPPKIPRLQ